MKNNYYDSIVAKVKDLIKAKNYDGAIEILTDELNQVFIPKQYEDIFHDLYNEAESYLEDYEDDFLLVTNKSDILKLLNGSLEQQFAAITSLEQLNIRNYTDMIAEYFISDQSAQLKGRLLDLCAIQKINEVFDYKVNGEIISVNPSLLEPVDEMEFITKAFDYFNNHLYKNPSLINMCQMVLVEKVYSIYPKVFLVDKVESICESIIEEVSTMFDVDSIESLSGYYN